MPLIRPRFFLQLGILIGLVGCGFASVPVIYLEQSHAGSFAFFTEETDRFQKYRLLLIDAHPDSSAAVDSDAIRDGLLSVSDLSHRSRVLDQWREEGRIQCYNWIEPLMPNTVESVYWMPPRELLRKKSPAVLTNEAVSYLDGRLEIDSRESGSFANRWKTIAGWNEVPADTERPWLVSIDLDAFAQDYDPEDALEKCWERVIRLHPLEAVSIAVSRPWQKDDRMAFRLWEKALRLALNTHPARVVLNGCSIPGKDDSLMAQTKRKEGSPVEEIDLSQAPGSMWSLISANVDNLRVKGESAMWETLFDSHKKEVPLLGIADTHQSLDGVWRVDTLDYKHLQVYHVPKGDCRFYWYRLVPASHAANLRQEDSAGSSFTKDAAECILWKEQLIAETEDPFLDHDTWRRHIPLGRSWWKVIVRSGDDVWETASSTICVTEGERFHAALSEEFGTPYMFGVGSVPYRGKAVAETGLGNDCANMIVYAWRRVGHKLPWCSPRELTSYMRKIGSFQKEGRGIPVSEEEKTNGIVIDALFHVAALWEDKAPTGMLGPEDILMHHLSGLPELISLREFKKRYYRHPISAWTLDKGDDPVKIAMLGDVVPIGIDMDWDLFCRSLKDNDLVIANAEGCVSDEKGKSRPGRKFIFTAESGAFAPLLNQAGIKVVSLANNHVEDGGYQGVLQTIRELKDLGVHPIGAGKTLEDAVTPAVVKIKQKVIAIWGVAHEEALHPPESMDVHLARLPRDYRKLLDSLNQWRGKVDVTILMIHWGQENTLTLSDPQREWSRRFSSAGFDIICGSHPHVVQEPGVVGASLIFPSLGNARFPTLGPLPDINKKGWGYVTIGGSSFRNFGVRYQEEKR